MKKNFEVWPLGQVPQELQRPELEQVKKLGYKFNDAREVVNIFEETIAKFCGSKFAISTDCCTNAVSICLAYLQERGDINHTIEMPSRIYPSIPMACIRAGYNLRFKDANWSGQYQLFPYMVYDSAVRFTRHMYIKDTFQCLSFQIKKRLPIGRGGMILTDHEDFYDFACKFRYDGRDLTKSQWEDEYSSPVALHCYMTPEDAARGLIIFNYLLKHNPSGTFPDTANQDNYADMSEKKIFQKYIVK